MGGIFLSPYVLENGFGKPRYTQIPNNLIDKLMPHLSCAELKVLLYLFRRTLGWHKNHETITQSEICKATELGVRSVQIALASLQSRKCIYVESGQDIGQPNTYHIQFEEDIPESRKNLRTPEDQGTQLSTYPGTQDPAHPNTYIKKPLPKIVNTNASPAKICRGQQNYEVPDHVLKTWIRTYPGIDVKQELQRAFAWELSNPQKRKTERGLTRFLNNWLMNAQDRGGVRRERTVLDMQSRQQSMLKTLREMEGEE